MIRQTRPAYAAGTSPEEIAAQIAAFESRGGKIQEISPGVTAAKEYKSPAPIVMSPAKHRKG